MSRYHPQLHHDAKSLVRVIPSSPVQPVSALTCVLQALAPSKEKLQARHALRERLCEIIQSNIGDDFDIQDMGMLNYADDLDIAPLELIIVVSAAVQLYLSPSDCGLLTVHP
jgi:hypothetical protein